MDFVVSKVTMISCGLFVTKRKNARENESTKTK